MHHLLLDRHQRVHRHPGIAEDRKLLHPVAHQNTARPHIDEDNPCQTLLLRTPPQQGSPELSPPRQLHKHVLPHEYLLDLERVPVVVCVGDDRSRRELIIANDVCHSLGIGVVTHSERSPHLFPEILNFDLFEGGLDELVDLGEDVLLPVLEELVLLDLGRLGFEEVLALDGGVGVSALLLDLVGGIEFLEVERNQELFNVGVLLLVGEVVAENVQLLVLVIHQLQDQLLHVLLVLPQLLEGI